MTVIEPDFGFKKPAWPEPVDFLADEDTGAPVLERHHIPAALWGFVTDTAQRIGVDPVALAVGALVTCSASVTDDWRVQPKKWDDSWTEQPRLWGAVVGDPSVRKSPIVSACTRPLDALDAEARKQHADDRRKWKIAHKIWKDNKSDPADEPMPPKLERRILESTTVEALSEALRDDEGATQRAPARKVLIRQDEMSELFANLDRYAAGGKGGGDRGAYLRLYNGGPYTVDRIGRGSFSIGNWSGCVFGGIQPRPIQEIAQKSLEDGLLIRFLYCVLSEQRVGVDRKPDLDAIKRYRDLIPALTALTPSRSGHGSISHIAAVTLHEDAHQFREDVDLKARVLEAMPDCSERLKATYGKVSGMFARIALTFHLIEGADARIRTGQTTYLPVLSEGTARMAADFVLDIIIPHLVRADRLMFRTPGMNHAQWIANWLLSRGLTSITIHDVTRAYKGLRDPEKKRELIDVMNTLVNVGWIAPKPNDDASRAPAWNVNPKVQTKFAERGERERIRRLRAQEDMAAEIRRKPPRAPRRSPT